MSNWEVWDEPNMYDMCWCVFFHLEIGPWIFFQLANCISARGEPVGDIRTTVFYRNVFWIEMTLCVHDRAHSCSGATSVLNTCGGTQWVCYIIMIISHNLNYRPPAKTIPKSMSKQPSLLGIFQLFWQISRYIEAWIQPWLLSWSRGQRSLN